MNDFKFEMVRQDNEKTPEERLAYLMENPEKAIICCLRLTHVTHPKPTVILENCFRNIID